MFANIIYRYVANPMDLSTLKLRTDALCYDTVAAFQRDLVISWYFVVIHA